MSVPEPSAEGLGLAKEARSLMSGGELDKAIVLLGRALREQDSFELRITLCEAYLRKKEAGEKVMGRLAQVEFEKTLDLAPADAEAHKNLVGIGVRLGAADKLLELYKTKWTGLPFAADQKKMLAVAITPPDRSFQAGKVRGKGTKKLLYLVVIGGLILILAIGIWLAKQGQKMEIPSQKAQSVEERSAADSQ